MTSAEVYPHILEAVRIIMQESGHTAETPNVDAVVHGALWSYVTHAVHEATHPSAPGADVVKQDRRSKLWTVIIRFWRVAPPSGLELIAETDPETVKGTGKLPELIEQYAAEMCPDDALFPSPLVAASIRERIPQLRNNLGRYSNHSLRIEYTYEGGAYVCQVDIAAA